MLIKYVWNTQIATIPKQTIFDTISSLNDDDMIMVMELIKI